MKVAFGPAELAQMQSLVDSGLYKSGEDIVSIALKRYLRELEDRSEAKPEKPPKKEAKQKEPEPKFNLDPSRSRPLRFDF